MEFSKSDYWNGLGSLSLLQVIFPTKGLNPSPTLQEDSLSAEPQGKPKNTGVGSLSLLQWIFLTQELNQDLLLCRWILCQLSHQQISRTLEWVTYLFSSGSSQPRNWTGVSCIVARFLTSWAIKKAFDTRNQEPQSTIMMQSKRSMEKGLTAPIWFLKGKLTWKKNTRILV